VRNEVFARGQKEGLTCMHYVLVASLIITQSFSTAWVDYYATGKLGIVSSC